MRQAGTLPTESEARRFAAWLTAQQIPSHAEEENGAWVIWVRDEDQLTKARQDLAHFREQPGDAKYQNAEQLAAAAQREAETRRRQAQGNVVEMRGRWGAAGGMPGAARRCPLTLAMIGACILAAMMASDDMNMTRGNGQPKPFGPIYRSLLFADPLLVKTPDDKINMWVNIEKGQVWRLITPIFIHYGFAHIILNLLCLYSFGGAIEDRRGSLFMLLLVLVLAVLSNAGQAIDVGIREQGTRFGGISGVAFGLFGYMAIKAKFDPRESYYLAPGTTFMALAWFAICILSDIPPFSGMLASTIGNIANTAHIVGLIAGAAIAYAPLLVRRAA